MGRNAGSLIHWTHVYDGTNHLSKFYCQQHANWGQSSTDLFDMLTLIAVEVQTIHGCIEQ